MSGQSGVAATGSLVYAGSGQSRPSLPLAEEILLAGGVMPGRFMESSRPTRARSGDARATGSCIVCTAACRSPSLAERSEHTRRVRLRGRLSTTQALAENDANCCAHTCTSGADHDFMPRILQWATRSRIHCDKSHPGRPCPAGPIHCVHQFTPRAVKVRRPTRRSPRLCRP